eukprot:GHVU01032023.1.p1 GENE.GHVU01032023.1~~GHVU01032023.1.p1  ORF type:complete len:150 (+),score=4.75 GHVU01032023.1:1324-1773(+)
MAIRLETNLHTSDMLYDAAVAAAKTQLSTPPTQSTTAWRLFKHPPPKTHKEGKFWQPISESLGVKDDTLHLGELLLLSGNGRWRVHLALSLLYIITRAVPTCSCCSTVFTTLPNWTSFAMDCSRHSPNTICLSDAAMPSPMCHANLPYQ